MAKPHASVNYVEPNFSATGQEFSGGGFTSWRVYDDFERAPRLEDYSITLNIEVEVCGRVNISQSERMTKDVLILSYTTKQSNGESVVNFLGGTKIYCNDTNNHYVNYLTTNYADMYVGDLVNYGTTEMIGIKSVDIDYQKSCVPIINIKFTDVRGLSLFQPNELSRTNAYQGIGGINADNVAQTFFQCFFRVPMPKFTITIKGFYGKPVTYEVLCDKFETSFNSDTGDFDIDTRFIGYSYSFLTDIVMDALLAAPYSDYGGRDGNFNKYWVQEQNSNRFTIWNREKTAKLPMPTLYEMYSEIAVAINNVNTDVETYVSEEEEKHQNEISDLKSLNDAYTLWYETLYNILCERHGKEYVYPFKEKGCTYRMLILVNKKSTTTDDLSYEYESFPDSFKEINQNLNSAISEYNSKGYKFRTIPSVSDDFSAYKYSNLFNRLFVNGNGDIIFNGFNKACNLPQTDVFSKVFYGVSYSGEAEEVSAQEIQHKKHVLSTIYNDGVDQYINCYVVDVDYSFIDGRIKTLTADASKDTEEKKNERRIHAINKKLLDSMKWYPSVENFTKIMMAHLETLMKQMYTCVDACKGRKANQLGVSSVNLDANISDDSEVPPFPRVFKDVQDDNGITTREDTWVGEFTGGIGFQEVDFINGLFNGAEKVMSLYHKALKAREEMQRQITVEASTNPLIKYPLASLDFYINKSPYGESSEIANDTDGSNLAGRIAIRMFNILNINYFRKEFSDKFFTIWDAKKVGRIEADNFYDTTKITSDRILDMIKNGVFSADNIINVITSKKNDNPWGGEPLFTKGDNVWLDCYKVSSPYINNIYPIQNINYNTLKTSHALLKQGKTITTQEGDISLWSSPSGFSYSKMPNAENYGFGTTCIWDDVERIEKQLNNANIDSQSGYSTVFETISSAVSFDIASSKYVNFPVPNDRFSISPSIKYQNSGNIFAVYLDKSDNTVVCSGSVDNQLGEYAKIGNTENYTDIGFSMSSKNGDIATNYTIKEIFGFDKSENGVFTQNKDKSFLKCYQKQKDDIVTSTEYSKKNGVDLTLHQALTTLALMGVIMNTDAVGEYIKNTTVAYLPRVIVLQIGAIIFAAGGMSSSNKANDIKNSARKMLPCDKISDKVFNYIAELNSLAKYQYVKYYTEWVKSNVNIGAQLTHINTNYIKNQDTNVYRMTLNENSKYVKDITNNLLKTVCLVKLSINHYIGQSRNNYKLPEGTAKKYLEGFVERLKEIYEIDTQKDDNGNIIKTTEEPNKTTPDMKKELYRYMKQIYDKWIPMSSFSDWKVEAFFDETKKGEGKGHKFYFIDSYYNDISHKLLINPKIIADKVEALLTYQDINSMLLGFMADMYSANKAMLMTIQNFFDLKKPRSMNEMFTPMSYNSIPWGDLNKYSSFVVVYPYQASRNLDIPNGEYENDGFMLNDEFETPMAIRSKVPDKEGQYMIPAFGVSYGKQYQSYFKKVNIDMKSPVATEQSIKAKHAILRKAGEPGQKGVVSQDLYDVYASQSYTCNVEMMGCAWVQPLMYFVLLNVPMFRGSYMIMRVKHSIRPGDMTTTFTGCRMANVSNKLIEDIFTDGDFGIDGGTYNEFESERQAKASIDNDCPYKIYPVYESNTLGGTWEGDEKGPTFSNRKAWATAMFHGWLSHGVNVEIAKVIVAQEALESAFGESNCAKKFNYGGVLSGGKCREFSSIDDFIQFKIDKSLNKYFPGALQAKTAHDYFNIIQNVKTNGGTGNTTGAMYCTSQDCVGEKYEKTIMNGNYYKEVCSYLSDVSTTPSKTPSGETADKKEKDIKDLFFDAVNKSAINTPSIGIPLRNLGEHANFKGYLRINQENGKTDKLAHVFDMIVNSEYYDFIQDIGWDYPDGGMISDVPPDAIFCNVTDSPEPNSKRIWAMQYGSGKAGPRTTPKISTKENECNSLLLKSLAKRRVKIGNDENFNKEVQQIDDVNGLDKYKPQDCNTLVSSGGYPSGPGSNSTWAKAVQSMGKWYEANIHTYQNRTPPNSGSGSRKMYNCAVGDWKGKVADDCSGFVSACLQYFGVFKSGFIPSSAGFTRGSDVASALSSKGFTKLAYSWDAVQPYDIISYNNGKSGHVEILAEKANSPKSWGWGSVHDGKTYEGKTRDIMPAKTGDKPKGTTYTTIWRYTA